MKNQQQLLQDRISSLELQLVENRVDIKNQFHCLLESISPLNYIKNSLHEMTRSSDVKTDLLNGVAGLTSGYLSNKIGLFGLAQAPIRSLIQFIGRKLF